MTQKEKMLAGELYNAYDLDLVTERDWAHSIMRRINTQLEKEKRDMLLNRILGTLGKDVWIEPPIFFDYGYNIEIGEKTFINFNCVFLDCNKIKIGKNVLIAPNVQVYTATHHVNPVDRAHGKEYALPVTVGDNVWLGGGAIVCAGVTIGENTTIGAGSVVLKDIPPNVFAAGNPCRVIRDM